MGELEIKTYLTTAEYRKMTGIELDEELKGTSDEEEGDGVRFIFRVEQKIMNYLSNRYGFKEEDIMKTENSLKRFKQAVINQIRVEIPGGEFVPIHEETKEALRIGGFMNIGRR